MVPGSGGSWQRTVWEQMEYTMFHSEIRASKGKEKQKEMKLRAVLPDLHFPHSAWSRVLWSLQRELRWFQINLIQSLKQEEKTCGMAESSLPSWLSGDAQNFAQRHVCLSNVPLPWIALETCSIQQDPVKRFKIWFHLHIFDREHKCSFRRLVSQIMLFLPLSGTKDYFLFFPAKCSCKNIVLTLNITWKFLVLPFCFYWTQLLQSTFLWSFKTGLAPYNHFPYLHRCTFISVFYNWKAFHFSL